MKKRTRKKPTKKVARRRTVHARVSTSRAKLIFSAQLRVRFGSVPLPRGYSAPREFEQLRKASGYTSARLSKVTLELLRRLEAKSVAASKKKDRWGWDTSAPQPGLDSLLYFDALERLGELPPAKRMGADE